MKRIPLFRLVASALAVAGALSLRPTCLSAAEPAAQSSNPEPAAVSQQLSPELMRSFLYLQEQVHAAQMAVERSQLEAQAAAARNNEALNARLQVIESALAQNQKDSGAAVEEASRQIRESNHQIMMFAGVFATLGFLALGLTGWLQWKALSRLHNFASPAAFPALLPAPGYEGLSVAQPPRQNPNPRLMDALGRLEHRIADLESGNHGAPLPEKNPKPQAAGGPNTGPVNDELAALIKEGEELLAHEDAEKAINHFDAILTKHPGHPEVLLRKGEALERLKRDQEAIECYDQAIRADKTLTMAYLHKGGLFNRMERFSEAMECYEQALKVQEGRAEFI